jgi:hypothetical protein
MGWHYNEALSALQAAHDVCFKSPGRDVLGMSNGPFSGVNKALGIIRQLEIQIDYERFRSRAPDRAFAKSRKPKPIRKVVE